MYNAETGEIHSYGSTKKNAIKQKRIIDASDHIGHGLYDVAKKVIYGRNGYSPNMVNFLNAHGNEIINKMIIVRHPVNNAIVGAMGVLSSGHFTNEMKNNNIDKLFHLMLYIVTDKNTKFVLEKIEEIRIVNNFKFASNDEQLPITSVPHISIDQLLDNTKRRMTETKFFKYSAADSNCQHFALNVLLANGINNQNYISFVKQNTAQLFNGQTNLRKVSNTLTDIAAKGDIIMQGGKIKKKKVKKLIHKFA